MPETTEQPSYEGYAAMSRFMNSSSGVATFRRFGELQVRNLLNIQCQVSDLERRIHARDTRPNVEHGSFLCDVDPTRRHLMSSLLREYNEVVLAAAAMHQLTRPKPCVTRVLKHFVEILRSLVGNEEPDLDVEDDLVSFKVDDDKELPSWVTETLRLGDWTPTTRSDEEKELGDLQTHGVEDLNLRSKLSAPRKPAG